MAQHYPARKVRATVECCKKWKAAYHVIMHESPLPLARVADQLAPPARSWAFAVNASVDCSDIEIALLSFVIVGEFARMTGLVRIRNRPNVRLASVPELALAAVGGSPLVPLSAHVLPHGAMAWVSWLFKRPPHVLNEYEGRIDRVDLDHQVGGRVARSYQPQLGTWTFRFQLPPPAGVSGMVAALAE
jgi:hypothetical protein